MSSRALRKAQREREQLELEKQQLDSQQENSGDDDDEPIPAKATKPSAFEMLGQLEDEDTEEHEAEVEETSEKEAAEDNNKEEEVAVQLPPKRHPQGNKKGKKSKHGKAHQRQQDSKSTQDDDFAASLEELNVQDSSVAPSPSRRDVTQNAEQEICRILSVDSNHLLVSNEMRRLFGRAAFEADQEERVAQSQSARANRSQEHIGLADAVTGRMSVGGPGLSAALRRRNIFAHGKEEWPRQTGNGLTMEVESTSDLGITTYRFVHTRPYQSAQHNFMASVSSMEPSNLVSLLRFQPYHIGTLLQVSEIAKQERDHSTSGELLERALFAFGKAVVPSFSSKLSQGKARLRFQRPENREFFLAVWRYITNISMRATWRTAFEWAKLLLSLDPEGDHQCVRLVIDQLALRAKQGKTLLELAQSTFFKDRWARLPNIAYSQSLAKRLTDEKLPSPSPTEILTDAVRKWPWVAARLFQELGIEKIPPSIWGSDAVTDKDKLHSEIYATFAQDLWKVPEVKAFLVDTVTKIDKDSIKPAMTEAADEISLDEGRFIILADKPPLIGLLPRSITSRIDSMSDPLPPEDNVDDYTLNLQSASHQQSNHDRSGDPWAIPRQVLQNNPRAFIETVRETEELWNTVVPVIRATSERGDGPQNDPEENVQQINRLISDTLRRTGRSGSVGQLRHLESAGDFIDVLAEQEDFTVISPDGAMAWLDGFTLRTSLPEDPPGRYPEYAEDTRTAQADDENQE